MNTFLDLLVVAVGAIAAVGAVSLGLLFLGRGQRSRRVGLYLASGLGLYLGYVGFRINAPGFPVQCVLAVALALAGAGAVMLHRVPRPGMEKLSGFLAAVSLMGGMINAFV